jgi:hypothetical protein
MDTELHFAICLNNKGYKASLEIGKIYRVIPDEDVAKHGYIRVFDESGEDHGYSLERFFPLELPQLVEEALCP